MFVLNLSDTQTVFIKVNEIFFKCYLLKLEGICEQMKLGVGLIWVHPPVSTALCAFPETKIYKF